MADTASIPRLSLKNLHVFVSDADELKKGTELFDSRGLEHLSRFENKIYADARGSGGSPYKVQIQFLDEAVKSRCSCMAARSRPVCKHGAALLVAWSRAPEGFVVSEAAPAGTGDAKKKAVKAGKADPQALMKGGVEQMGALLRELALSGVASLAADRAAQVKALGESLRESRLRRLSARGIALSEMLATAATAHERFDVDGYAGLFTDAVLTLRKLEKHLGGEPLEDRYVEELIGKTWTKKDRAPVSGLELVEYAFRASVTPDHYVIRESRFFDLRSGAHYSEKQILPEFLARRQEPKKSHAGWVLFGAAGSQYPGFPPLRVDLETPGDRLPLGGGEGKALEALLERCIPSVSAAVAAFQEHRKDVFAPDAMPVAVRVDTVQAEHQRMQVVDRENGALFLPDQGALEEQLASALRGVRLEAVLGDITLDGALPTLVPQAVVVTPPGSGRELRAFSADAAAVLGGRKVKVAARAVRDAASRSSWVDTARAAGMSPAAIALGEVREELAQALVTGMATLTPRFADPLAARVAELGLAKPAQLLQATAAKQDPAEKIDDFVKLYQVLGIALARLAGATHVDRAALTPVPTYESVQVNRTDEVLTPREVAAKVAAGELNRYQAAVRYAAHYERIDPAELAASLYPTWADGSASPFVARAFAARPQQALEAARRALGLFDRHEVVAWRRSHARVAKLTALAVLEAVGGKDAEALLAVFVKKTQDESLRGRARRILARIRREPPDPAARTLFDKLRDKVMSGSNKHDRQEAMRELAERGMFEAIPYLRASLLGDVSSEVREAAAYALGELGDVESVDLFVRMLRERGDDPAQAKTGAYALGWLGDVRGIDALLDAWEEVWHPQIIADSIKHIGVAALEPLVQRIERNPELVKRKAALNVVEALEPHEVAEWLCAHLERIKDAADFVPRASLALTLAGTRKISAVACGKKVLELRPGIAQKSASKEEKALFRRCGAVN